MVFNGVKGPVTLDVERMNNQAVVYPQDNQPVFLIDAVSAVLDVFGASEAMAVKVTQPEGPALNIQSMQSRDLFESDGRSYRYAPAGAIYEVSAASQGGC